MYKCLCGPFTGEFGDEILAWIPFLRAQLGDDFKNALAISRGGTASWYPCKVLNAYDVVPVDEFRGYLAERLEARNTTKPMFGDKLDALILERFGYGAPSLYPLSLYPSGRPNWWQHCEKFAPVDPYPGLPERYIAVRFYKNAWLYEAPPIKEDLPIVGLHVTDQPDNHPELDYPCDFLVNYDAVGSFHVLSRIISHADKFICNYGSMAFLGISYGVNVEAYTHYPEEARRAWHHKIENKVAKKCGGSLSLKTFEPRRRIRWNRMISPKGIRL